MYLVEYWPGGRSKSNRWQKAGACPTRDEAEAKVADLVFRVVRKSSDTRITEMAS